jgi:hypothetical protein
MSAEPALLLSVIVVAHRDSENLRLALRRLGSQTIASRIECILVVPSEQDLTSAVAPLGGIHFSQVVAIQPGTSEGEAKAAGVAAARAPLVAFMEDHSYPAHTCAETLVRAHGDGDYAAVGPVIRNANPRRGRSWGCFLAFYGTWMTVPPEGEVEHLPANQSCYRREVLLEYGPRLSGMLEAESVLHADLRARDRKLRLEPKARVYHLNYSRLVPAVSEYYLASRVFAARRAAGWPVFKRAVYTLGSPLLPLVRSLRILAEVRRAAIQPRTFLTALAPLLLILSAGAAGEMLGYSLGTGTAAERLMKFERERDAAFTSADLEAVSSS